MKILRQKLTIGSDTPLAVDSLPHHWRPFFKTQPPEKVNTTALALLSHYQTLSEFPTPPSHLTPQPLLPPLNIPPVPKNHHHLLAQITNQVFFINLLRLLHSRGYSLPINFWQKIPKSIKSHLPDEYSPWLAHLAGRMETKESITADNWGDFSPASRLAALRSLRQKNPTIFRQLLAQHLGREKAAERLKIVEIFADNLMPEDLPYLQSLQKERSQKITALVDMYLLQLGENPKKMSDMIETLRECFYISHEKEKTKIHFAKPPKYSREKIFHDLNVVDITLLSQSLGLKRHELILSFHWTGIRPHESPIFLKKFIPYLSEKDTPIFFKRYVTYLLNLGYFLPRGIEEINLPPDYQEKIALILLQQNKSSLFNFYSILYFLQRPFSKGSITFSELKATKAWHNLKRERIFHDASALGFLLPQEIAQQALADLEKRAQLRETTAFNDETLAPLRLNAQLSKHIC